MVLPSYLSSAAGAVLGYENGDDDDADDTADANDGDADDDDDEDDDDDDGDEFLPSSMQRQRERTQEVGAPESCTAAHVTLCAQR